MEQSTTTTNHQAEVAHDLILADLYAATNAAARQLASARAALDFALQYNKGQGRIDEANTKVATALATYQASITATLDHEDAYTGWSRFYLVTNSGGHIHRTMTCSTCFSTTEFAFLPEMSGRDDADVVEAEGEILCSVCYPDAPVAWTSGTSKRTQADRDARAEAKADRDAKKAAKQLFADGSSITLDHERITTITAAKSRLTDAAEWAAIYEARGEGGHHPCFPPAEVVAVAEALAARTDDTVEAVLAAAVKRAAKR